MVFARMPTPSLYVFSPHWYIVCVLCILLVDL